VLVLILVTGIVVTELRADTESPETFACSVARRWTRQYGQVGKRLRVLRVDILFPGGTGKFESGEGVVVAPVGLDLDGLQKVVATAASPAGLGIVRFEGTANQLWSYPGSLHRDLRYTALSLVRPVRASLAPEDSRAGAFDSLGLPSLDFVRSDVMYEAGLTASETGQNGLDRCEDFASWATKSAGWGDASQRFLALARRVGSGTRHGDKNSFDENICTAVREGRFSLHQAQVAVVMGARAAGLPAFALTGASTGSEYLAAVWTGGRGWRAINLDAIDAGYLHEPPALLAKAPVLGSFAAADHDFWRPTATAYSPVLDDGRYEVLSATDWAPDKAMGPPRTPQTRVRSMSLAEVCP